MLIVFDTNILYESTDSSCNFCDFKFNKMFNNVQERIEQYDLTEYVYIGISKIVWKELHNQRFNNYSEKKSELDKITSKYRFPGFELKQTELDYADYLVKQIDDYKKKLGKYQTKIVEIDLPSNSRFQSIIRRALDKKPPFEGEKKKSDKGFKDSLIWESLLDYKYSHPNHKIALYTRDGLFNEFLAKEFQTLFREEIYLSNTEEGIMVLLSDIQRHLAYKYDSSDDYSKFYILVREIVTESFIIEILFELELKEFVGINCYDLSSVKNPVIIDVIDVTDDNNIEGLTFELKIEADISLSSVDRHEDIILLNEPFQFYIEYNLKEENFFLTKIVALKEVYGFDKFKIEGV